MNSTRHSVECFRPLSGSYISQLWQAELWEWNLWCFRPLSGSYISQWNCTLTTVTYISRFRPLSGSYISQFWELPRIKLFIYLFPSPIGELHFSIAQVQIPDSFLRVSVPYRGATFLNNLISPKQDWNGFPSPIGELHFSIVFSAGTIN